MANVKTGASRIVNSESGNELLVAFRVPPRLCPVYISYRLLSFINKNLKYVSECIIMVPENFYIDQGIPFCLKVLEFWRLLLLDFGGTSFPALNNISHSIWCS